MVNRLLVLLLAGVLAVALTAGMAFAQQQSGGTATAELRDGEGNLVGTAEFVEVPEGVGITVNVQQGVDPGEHAIHVHESADLSDPSFESAGGHLDPADAQHGLENPEGPEAGDLENIVVGEDGTASYETINTAITLGPGEASLLDGDGSALIIHAMADDYTTDDDPENGPGNSGDRIAAGEIVASEPGALVNTGGPNPTLLATGAIVVLSLLAAGGLFLPRLRRGA